MSRKTPQTLLLERFCDILERETGVRSQIDQGAERGRQRKWGKNILDVCGGDAQLAYRVLERWAMEDVDKPMGQRNVHTYPTLANVAYRSRVLAYQIQVEDRQPQGETFKGMEMPGNAHKERFKGQVFEDV